MLNIRKITKEIHFYNSSPWARGTGLKQGVKMIKINNSLSIVWEIQKYLKVAKKLELPPAVLENRVTVTFGLALLVAASVKRTRSHMAPPPPGISRKFAFRGAAAPILSQKIPEEPAWAAKTMKSSFAPGFTGLRVARRPEAGPVSFSMEISRCPPSVDEVEMPDMTRPGGNASEASPSKSKGPSSRKSMWLARAERERPTKQSAAPTSV